MDTGGGRKGNRPPLAMGVVAGFWPLRCPIDPPMQEPAEQKPSWMGRLARHWGVSTSRAAIILVVFACTGFTIMFLKRPIVGQFTENGEQPLLFSIAYYVLIFPVYNVVLLVYGAVFGQFRFFWEFEKRFFGRLLGRKAKDQSPK